MVGLGGLAAAAVIALGAGVIRLPGAANADSSAQAAGQAAPGAQQLAADRQWAAATCTSLAGWRSEMERDLTGLSFGGGALSKLDDAVTATSRALNGLSTRGLPPSAQTARVRAQLDQLRSDLQARLQRVQHDAASLAGGDLTAVAALLADLNNDRTVVPQIAGQLRGIVSTDLGLSLAETPACRALVGISI